MCVCERVCVCVCEHECVSVRARVCVRSSLHSVSSGDLRTENRGRARERQRELLLLVQILRVHCLTQASWDVVTSVFALSQARPLT